MNVLGTPQEIEVWIFIPAIRRAFAIGLKKKGLKYREIAGILGLTVPAISQYINNKRAKGNHFPDKLIEEIEHSVKKLADGKVDANKELQRVLKFINDNKIICTVCKEQGKVTDTCNICY